MHKNNIINLLGIQENLVKKVERFENYINIFLETSPKLHVCPSCKHLTNHIHDYRIQKIQHTSIGHISSFLILKKRRYVCTHCGKRFFEKYDFLQKYFRKSNAVFNNVCDDLKSLKNFKTIAKDNNVSTPTVVRYMHYNYYFSNKHNFALPEKLVLMNLKVTYAVLLNRKEKKKYNIVNGY